MATHSPEEMLIKRFEDLAEQSYQNNSFYFTDFLTAVDAANAYQITNSLSIWGGAEGCDRVMIRFGDEEEFGYSVPFPIKIVKVEPLLQKFAQVLSHRDYLGALMNLGIERDVIGDIVVKDKIAYVFVVERIADYICENIDSVSHTNVKCSVIDTMPEEVKVELQREELVVSSVRLDAIVAKLYHLSRNQALELFRKKLVLVNGRICENNSMTPKDHDTISVRGHGKFIYQQVAYDTKKGKQAIWVDRYM